MSHNLKRRITLLQATSINMIDMVGIGPFVVIPLVIGYFNSPLFLWAWIFGALIAYLDGMIWSELGASYPLAGGSYNFLREAYGKKGGKLMSFLFVWQTSIQAPLVVASGSIGFAQYVKYLVPLNLYEETLVSVVVIVFLVLLLLLFGSLPAVLRTIRYPIIFGLTMPASSLRQHSGLLLDKVV